MEKKKRTIDSKTLKYKVSYTNMNYGQRILIKISSKYLLDLANIKFYSNNNNNLYKKI